MQLRGGWAYIEREREALRYRVGKLERATREQLVRSYGEDLAWRGLATDDFLVMADMMEVYEKVLIQEQEI